MRKLKITLQIVGSLFILYLLVSLKFCIERKSNQSSLIKQNNSLLDRDDLELGVNFVTVVACLFKLKKANTIGPNTKLGH